MRAPRRRGARKRQSSDDASVGAGFVGVSGDRFVGFEVQVALQYEKKQATP